MNRLQGKVCIVTGAGRIGNIGLAVCEAFLREGAAGVVATDVRQEEAEEITARVEEAHGADRFRLISHDATSEADWNKVIDETVATFGSLDVLVNNAGIAVHAGIMDTSLDDLRKVMAVNHDALFLGIKGCTPYLAEAVSRHPGGGAIINNVSMASYMANAFNIGYHVSKSAARMLTLCASKEFGSRNIRVNSIHPGVTMTPLIRQGLEDYAAQGLWESADAAETGLKEMSPLNMVSQPEDAAHAFVYLASDEARFVTGASIYHDGGIGSVY